MISLDSQNAPSSSLKSLDFSKRSLSWRSLGNLLLTIFSHFRSLGSLRKNPPLSPAFQERILLAVTSVNNCRYCSFFHTKMALEAGCNEQEIQMVLDHDISCVDPHEAPALVFAQHFADSHESPSREALKSLVNFYGLHRSHQIIASCLMITVGNLFGNTIDAYIARSQGVSVSQGNRWMEGLLYYLVAPYLKSFSSSP